MNTTTTSAAPVATGHPHGARTVGPIVVATTGDDGVCALKAAERLAARARTTVLVVSVVTPPPPGAVGLDGDAPWPPDPEADRALRRQRVAEQVRQIAGDGGAWPIEVLVDSPPRAIAEAAIAHRAALLVMGIGRHDLAARLAGSEVVLQTIRHARVPVLAVADKPFPVPPRVAVAAIDFSPSSVHAAHAALELLGDGGTLHLVHVWSRTAIGHRALLEHDDAYERALPRRFAQVERALLDRARDVSILPTSLVGDTVEQVVAFARTHDADLIAAGRQGHRLLERLLVGHFTARLIRTARCAVLVTPEPAVAERAQLERTLTGTAESHDRDEWPALLDAFSRQNAGRRTALEIDDSELGAQAQETGYTFLGATYDRHDGRVALMLGAAAGGGGAAHLTHSIDGATSVAVQAGAGGRDAALSVRRGDGQTLLTFLPDAM